MISGIAGIAPIRTPEALSPAANSKKDGGDFKSMLETSIRSVEATRTEANVAIEQFLTGERDDLHKVALSAQKADLTFELFVQTRNKVVQAYQEIMRMQF